MADGKNEARALRILEIINDFRTLQIHINSLVTRPTATPPDQASAALVGYRLLRESSAEARRLLAINFDPGNLGINPGQMPATEAQKTVLRSILLDAATRRFQAHRVYLRAAAGTRWVQNRNQILQGQRANDPRRVAALQALDQRLQQELSALTDQHVYDDLRAADVRKGYWVAEDDTLQRILAWLRRQT